MAQKSSHHIFCHLARLRQHCACAVLANLSCRKIGRFCCDVCASEIGVSRIASGGHAGIECRLVSHDVLRSANGGLVAGDGGDGLVYLGDGAGSRYCSVEVLGAEKCGGRTGIAEFGRGRVV